MCEERNDRNVQRNIQRFSSQKMTRITIIEQIEMEGGDVSELMDVRESLGLSSGLRRVLDEMLQDGMIPREKLKQLVRR